MNSTLSLLLAFLNQFFMPRHNAQLRLLKAQISILRARIPTDRIILSPAEKAELLRIGEECGHDVDGLTLYNYQDNKTLDLFYILAPLSGKAKDAEGSTGLQLRNISCETRSSGTAIGALPKLL